MKYLLKWMRLSLTAALITLAGCKTGEITEYQLPASIHRAFKKDHPKSVPSQYTVQTRDGVKVYQIDFFEDEAEHIVFYDVQGRPFVSKADRRRAEQERDNLEEEGRQAAAEANAETPGSAPVPAPDSSKSPPANTPH